LPSVLKPKELQRYAGQSFFVEKQYATLNTEGWEWVVNEPRNTYKATQITLYQCVNNALFCEEEYEAIGCIKYVKFLD
jgi:hypothetical protein